MIRLALFGTGASAEEFLKVVRETPGVEVVFAATSAEDSLARHLHLPGSAVAYFDRTGADELYSLMLLSEPDVLVSITSPFVFEERWLRAARLGAYNLHPAPLPRFAGFYPHVWALIEGAAEHGVTLHRMTPKIDGGGIVAQRMFAIDAKETALSLYMKCVRATAPVARDFLERLAHGPIEGESQDLTHRSYYRRRIPLDGKASFRWPAVKLERVVRAFTFAPFPSPIGELSATVHDGPTVSVDRVEIATADAMAAPGTLMAYDANDAIVACGEAAVRIRQLAKRPARETLESFGLRPGSVAFSE